LHTSKLLKMELNIFNSKIGEEAKVPQTVDEESFWRFYFKLLALLNQTINQREEDILAWILSRKEGVDYLSAPNNRQLKDDLRISYSELSRLKQKLQAKRLIDEDNMPHVGFIKLQRFMRNNPEISFILPMKIV
jgi:hypothetical protein